MRDEFVRKGWHMLAGGAAIPFALYAGLEFTTVFAAVVLVAVFSLEWLERYGLRVPFFTAQLLMTRRKGERFAWAAVVFVAVAVAILWLAPLPVAFAALAVLGFGDGFSALIGRPFGRHKIWYNRRKSWEGTFAGLVAGFVGGWVLSAWYFWEAGVAFPTEFLPVLAAGAVAGMVAESTPDQQDNLSVPLAAAAAMVSLWLLVGLEPTYGELFEWIRGL